MKKEAYLITNIEEYGKLISFCIDNDISVFRTYWSDQDKGNRCYCIDWKEKRCYYASRRYYETKDYKVITPAFQINAYGEYKIIT